MAELRVEEKEGALIARLVVPKHYSEEEIDELGRGLAELPDRSDGKILLDLQDVEFIYSVLLAKLVSLHKACRTSKTDLRLCNVPPLIMDVIKISRLDKFFKIHESVEEAMSAD